MPDFIVLVPIFVLAIGAIVIPLAAEKLSAPARRWLPIVFLTLEIIAILSNIAPSSHRFEISTWDLASFSIAFQVDGIAVVLLLAIFIPLIALQLVSPRITLDPFALFVLSTAVLLICADNLITVFFAWACLDFALFAWREARRIPHDIAIRALVLSQLSGLVLFTGIVLLGGKQNDTAAVLIALGFWARLGLFPFQWIFPNADLKSLELTSIRGASIVAGASLWLYWDRLKISVPIDLIVWLAGIALVAALIWIAREGEVLDNVAVNASVASIAVPTAMAFGGEAAFAFSLWIVLGIALALAMIELGLMWPSDYQSRWARLYFIVGVLSLAGLPLAPTFLGKVGVYVALAERGEWILLLLAVAATTFVLAPLARTGVRLRGSEQREPKRIEYAGLQLLGFTVIVISFAPIVIVQAISQAASDSANQAINTVIRTNDFIGAGSGFVALIVPILISFLLARVNWGYHPQWDELTQFANRVIDLDWLARLVATLGQDMSEAARSLSMLAEENITVWILLVGLWIAIFILTSR